VVRLAIVGLQLLELRAVLELGAHGGNGGDMEKSREGGPGYHRESRGKNVEGDVRSDTGYRSKTQVKTGTRALVTHCQARRSKYCDRGSKCIACRSRDAVPIIHVGRLVQHR
jgi:hypothetical protein